MNENRLKTKTIQLKDCEMQIEYTIHFEKDMKVQFNYQSGYKVYYKLERIGDNTH